MKTHYEVKRFPGKDAQHTVSLHFADGVLASPETVTAHAGAPQALHDALGRAAKMSMIHAGEPVQVIVQGADGARVYAITAARVLPSVVCDAPHIENFLRGT